jgi:hypothetical protein
MRLRQQLISSSSSSSRWSSELPAAGAAGSVGSRMKPRRPADMGKVLMGMVLVQLVMVLSLLLDSTPVVKCVQGARHVDESLKRSAAFAQPASLQNVIRVELIHRDHPASPLSSSSDGSVKSFPTRFAEAVERSYSRAAYFATRMRSSSSTTTTIPAARAVGYTQEQKFESGVSAGTGEYLMSLSLGTPPQQFAAIVDTGSDLNWVQCLPCRTCYQQTSNKFDPSRSSTYRDVPCANQLCQALPIQNCVSATCDYEYVYGDQSSTSGELAFDTISLANGGGAPEGIPNFAFGCGHANQGTFAGAGGLVGLGQGPVSLVSQLSSTSTFPDRFSYCLVSLNAATTTTSALLFGNVNTVAGIQYTPIIRNAVHPTYYYVQMVGISVGGVDLGINPSTFDVNPSTGAGGTILDSGTTISMLTLPAYEAVLEAFQREVAYPLTDGTPYGLDLCFDIAGVTNPTVPDMTFHFQGGANFLLLPENLFAIVDALDSVMCMAMAGSEGFSIIGNIQQQDHLVIYDRVAQRIGFANANC